MFLKTSQLSKKLFFAISMLCLSVMTFAQDKKVDISIGTKSEDSNIFMQPWVWVVGGAVFILLLVALIRGGKKS